MRIRNAFTMIELIFVIVVMGIIGKFGVEFLAQAYKSFIFSSVNNALQSKSASAVEFIASRLQYRIKDSVIARTAAGAAPTPIGSAAGETFTVLEWVGSDIDGYRGITAPYWSGVVDFDAGNSGLLNSPGTSAANADTLISTLAYGGGSNLNSSALYFIGSNSDVTTDYAWNGAAITNQSAAIHPILGAGANFTPRRGDNSVPNNFINSEIYEYYKLAWTAYAIVYTPGANNMGTLTLWYDYQPWNGETYTANGRSAVIMEGVSAFQYMAIGSIIKIQVCAKSELVEDYSLCKEKTVF